MTDTHKINDQSFYYQRSIKQTIVDFGNCISDNISNSKSLFENIVKGNLSSDYSVNTIVSPSQTESPDNFTRVPFTLYCSDKSSTSKCTSHGDDLSSDDDDYGFYDDNEFQGMNISLDSTDQLFPHQTSPIPANKFPKLQGSYKREKKSKHDTKLNLVCVFENSKASLSCKSFKMDGKVEMARISMQGCRIVQSDLGISAEYKFILSLESIEYVVWKQFSDFRLLANSILEYNLIKKAKGPFYYNTISAWKEVIHSRPWFYQDLSVRYLTIESSLLNAFMVNLFYEVESLNIFLEFVK